MHNHCRQRLRSYLLIEEPFGEEAPHVQVEIEQLDDQHTNELPIHCTPDLEHQVNEFLQSTSRGINTSYPPSLPWLSSGRQRTTRHIHVDEGCTSGT